MQAIALSREDISVCYATYTMIRRCCYGLYILRVKYRWTRRLF